MRSIKSTGISDEKFRPWLRHELGRAVRQGLLLLVAGCVATLALVTLSSGFASVWTSFNYQLSSVALDEHPLALGGDGKGQPDLAIYLDRAVGTGRHALPAADTGLIHDLEQQRLVPRHRNRIGRADPDACQACDTELGVDDEIQRA